jgi:dihydroorotate dehydrogenase
MADAKHEVTQEGSRRDGIFTFNNQRYSVNCLSFQNSGAKNLGKKLKMKSREKPRGKTRNSTKLTNKGGFHSTPT